MKYPITESIDKGLSETEYSRRHNYEEGYKEGHSDAISLQYTFSKVLGETIAKLKCEIVTLTLERHKYRSALQDLESVKTQDGEELR